MSGIPQNIVREVLEYMLINWSIKISDNPDTFSDLPVPFLGKVCVRYSGDIINPSGDLSTEVECFAVLEDNFKKLIGDLHDEAKTELVNILQKKIEQAVMVASSQAD